MKEASDSPADSESPLPEDLAIPPKLATGQIPTANAFGVDLGVPCYKIEGEYHSVGLRLTLHSNPENYHPIVRQMASRQQMLSRDFRYPVFGHL